MDLGQMKEALTSPPLRQRRTYRVHAPIANGTVWCQVRAQSEDEARLYAAMEGSAWERRDVRVEVIDD